MSQYDHEENAVANNPGGVSETPSDLVGASNEENKLSPNPAGFGFTKQLTVDELPENGKPNTLYLLRVKNNGVVVGYRKFKWTPTDGFTQFGATPDLKLEDGIRETPIQENNAPKEAPEKVFKGDVVFEKEPTIQGMKLSDFIAKVIADQE